MTCDLSTRLEMSIGMSLLWVTLRDRVTLNYWVTLRDQGHPELLGHPDGLVGHLEVREAAI